MDLFGWIANPELLATMQDVKAREMAIIQQLPVPCNPLPD